MSKFSGKFERLVETAITRYQQGGFLVGDIVKIKKNALKNPKIQERPSQFIDAIQAMIDGKTQLKISAVKSDRPTTTDVYGGANAVTGYWVDVVEEYAPGMWKNAMTLPAEILEYVNVGNNRDPVPDNLKRKSENTKPEKVEKSDRDDVNQSKLSDKNEKLEHTPAAKDGRDQTKKPKDYKVKESVDAELTGLDQLINEVIVPK